MQVVEEDKARLILWEDPLGNPGNAGLGNLEGARLEATFSPNGTSMIIVRRDDNVSGTDMYLSQWNGRTWSAPMSMKSVNSLLNDRGPSFRAMENFSISPLIGKEGREDTTCVTQLAGRAKGGRARACLGLDVNTASDERGPSLSPDGKRLFFSSDRAGKGEDIFVSNKVVEEPDLKRNRPPKERRILSRSSREPSQSTTSIRKRMIFRLPDQSGRSRFLASDRDRDDKSGFSLFLSRVVDGQELA